MTVFLAAASIIYIFDQTSKYLVERYLSQGDTIPVINGFFHITLVHNKGGAFGIFSSHPLVFSLIAAVCAVCICFFLYKKHRSICSYDMFALSFILSGTLGNLTDRIRTGSVIDFIDLRIWPVFNIADSFISIGVGMLILAMFWKGEKAECHA